MSWPSSSDPSGSSSGAFDWQAVAAAAKHQTIQLRDAAITLLALTIFVNLLRFGTRMFLLKDRFTRLTGDDWLMALAQVSFMISTIGTIVYDTTTDYFSSIPSPQKVSDGIKLTSGAYILAVTFVKLSIGWNFAALSRHSAKWIATVIAVVSIISGLFGFGFFLYTVAACGVAASVNTGSMCKTENAYSLTNIVWSFTAAFSEVILAALIFYFIIRYTQLPRNLKILVLALFSIGVLGFVSSFIRASYVYRTRGSTGLGYGLRVALWSTIEAGTCIIAASLSTLKPLVVKGWRKVQPSALKSWNTRKSTAAQNTTVDQKEVEVEVGTFDRIDHPKGESSLEESDTDKSREH